VSSRRHPDVVRNERIQGTVAKLNSLLHKAALAGLSSVSEISREPDERGRYDWNSRAPSASRVSIVLFRRLDESTKDAPSSPSPVGVE
jgi:hypothetical protein